MEASAKTPRTVTSKLYKGTVPNLINIRSSDQIGRLSRPLKALLLKNGTIKAVLLKDHLPRNMRIEDLYASSWFGIVEKLRWTYYFGVHLLIGVSVASSQPLEDRASKLPANDNHHLATGRCAVFCGAVRDD